MIKVVSTISTVAVIAAALTFTGPARAADVKTGAKLFNRCKACHTLVAGKNRIGPSLHGVFGRKAGTVEGYRYSKALKLAGAEGLVWNDQTLDKWLAGPKDLVKKTRMSFPGLKKPADRENLIAFLKEAAK